MLRAPSEEVKERLITIMKPIQRNQELADNKATLEKYFNIKSSKTLTLSQKNQEIEENNLEKYSGNTQHTIIIYKGYKIQDDNTIATKPEFEINFSITFKKIVVKIKHLQLKSDINDINYERMIMNIQARIQEVVYESIENIRGKKGSPQNAEEMVEYKTTLDKYARETKLATAWNWELEIDSESNSFIFVKQLNELKFRLRHLKDIRKMFELFVYVGCKFETRNIEWKLASSQIITKQEIDNYYNWKKERSLKEYQQVYNNKNVSKHKWAEEKKMELQRLVNKAKDQNEPLSQSEVDHLKVLRINGKLLTKNEIQELEKRIPEEEYPT